MTLLWLVILYKSQDSLVDLRERPPSSSSAAAVFFLVADPRDRVTSGPERDRVTRRERPRDPERDRVTRGPERGRNICRSFEVSEKDFLLCG